MANEAQEQPQAPDQTPVADGEPQLSYQAVFKELVEIPEAAPWLQVAQERALRKEVQRQFVAQSNELAELRAKAGRSERGKTAEKDGAST